FIMLIFGASTFILLMLLPALLELRKPKDAGPRIIMNDAPITQSQIPLANMEEEHKSNKKIVNKIASIIAALPNLES
ncbi:MAG: hypothetical protein QXH37_03165, partial [Candidatus Bathyarchaeia archaeon]